jgi:hypothetical protein
MQKDIWRQRYELRKQLQDLYVDVALVSGTHFKPHERFFIPNYHFYQTGHFPGRKCGTAVTVKNGIPYKQVAICHMRDTYT